MYGRRLVPDHSPRLQADRAQVSTRASGVPNQSIHQINDWPTGLLACWLAWAGWMDAAQTQHPAQPADRRAEK